MLGHSIVIIVVASLSALPRALAEEDKAPKKKENHNLQPGLVAAVTLVILVIAVLPLAIFYHVRRIRRKSAAQNKDVAVEASQMEGPPTVLRATYDPGSGHSIYAIGSAGSGAYPTAVIAPTPSANGANSSVMGMPGTPNTAYTPGFPVPAIPSAMTAAGVPLPYSPAPAVPMTAPAHKTSFSQSSSHHGQRSAYPFTGMGSSSGQPPKSALVSSGAFPRPLLAGRSLKDRIKERPPSASVLVNEFEVPKTSARY